MGTIDHKVQDIVQGLSKARGENFFDNIVLSLADAIDADFTIVSSLNPELSKATTIAVGHDKKIIDGFSYSLKGTPCFKVSQGDVTIHDDAVIRCYPEFSLLNDLGIQGYVGIPLFDSDNRVSGLTVALYQNPIEDSQLTKNLFLLFSGMISGELERLDQTTQLEMANNIIENTAEAIVIANTQGNIIHVNHAFEALLGFHEESIKHKPLECLMSSKNTVNPLTMINNRFKPVVNHWSGENWFKKKNGHEFPGWLNINAIFNEKTGETNIVATISDMSQAKKQEEKLRFQETHDDLTKLPNRKSFMEQLNLIIDNSKRKVRPFALLLIDLDLFKNINDVLGHAFGDKLLLEVANRLSSQTREGDFIARLASDEFAMIVEEVNSPEVAAFVSEKLIEVLKRPFLIEGKSLSITATVGITLFPFDVNEVATPELLLSHADHAVVSLKENGGDGFCFFTNQMQEKAERRMELKNHLLEAIQNKSLILAYQPIFNLQNGELEKFEALLRWNLDGQWIPPVEFIPLAEEFGLITAIGQQVLDMACSTLKYWEGLGFKDIRMAINRSMKEWPTDATQTPKWLETLESYGISPKNIEFEITESLLAPENTVHIQYLNKLRNAGSKIALDDFGTGYSSLSYLRRFSADVLKIDRSFVLHLHESPDDKVLVSTVIAMAKSLGITVVAEGVELEEQLSILSSLGCHYIQGYLLSKPLMLEEATQFLTTHEQQRKLLNTYKSVS